MIQTNAQTANSIKGRHALSENQSARDPRDHPFVLSPHTTLAAMSIPVLLSLIAEPLTGLFDTAFISRLGAVPLAAVGVGSTAFSSIFWAFNFLGIGTQTEVANAFGRQEAWRVKQIGTIALLMSVIIGLVLIGMVFPLSSRIVTWMGPTGDMHTLAVSYFQIRLFGAPPVLLTIAAFGIMRGLQDMRTPLKIAVSLNTVNIILDAVLIFGLGPAPPLGVAGAALASVASQWVGAAWAVAAIYAGPGLYRKIQIQDGRKLLRIGGHLFIRTGMLTVFLLLTTRAATLIGPESGAAHQAIRQFWIFTALFLDAYAISGQSLVGYFMGTRWMDQAKRVAKIVCSWSVGLGLLMGVAMLVGQGFVEHLFVPLSARESFGAAWIVTCAFQPLNALAFGTDGIHWGTGDFRFLRNVVILATLCGAPALFLLDGNLPNALVWIWIITGAWIAIRAIFGVARIWPAVGSSPFKEHA